MLRKKAPEIPKGNGYFTNAIYDGALNNKGKAFTIVRDYRTEETAYERVKGGFFSKSDYWKKSKYGNYTFYPDIDSHCKSIPKECSYFRESVVISDSRNSSMSNKAIKVTGYRLTINVPEYYSSEIYETKYANIGVPFKEKLLAQHHLLMERLTIYDDRRYLMHHIEESMKAEMARIYATESTIFVCVNGISRHSPNDSEFVDYGRIDLGIMFSDYAMPDLDGIAQCYGMALAIIEILKPKWEKCGTVATRFIHHSSAGTPYLEIRYRLDQPIENPLGSW